MIRLSAKKVEDAIGILKANWPGRCHQIAAKLQDTDLMPESFKLMYGHWLGPIDSTPSEHNPFAGRPFTHHGWLQDGDTIIDPTRWCFEGLPPRRAYIFIGTDPDGYYDAGSNKLRESLRGDPPAYDPDAEQVNDFNEFLARHTFKCGPGEMPLPPFVHHLLGQVYEPSFNPRQLMWLANTPPQSLGDYAKPLYLALVDAGYETFIPIDNRDMILGE